MTNVINKNVERAEKIVSSWPEWQKSYQLTKYKVQAVKGKVSSSCRKDKDGKNDQ